MAIVAALLLAAIPVQARTDRCAQRMRKAELRLERAVRRYGRHSRQAEHRRRQLDQVRSHCGLGRL